jgi:hypothetical protein
MLESTSRIAGDEAKSAFGQGADACRITKYEATSYRGLLILFEKAAMPPDFKLEAHLDGTRAWWRTAFALPASEGIGARQRRAASAADFSSRFLSPFVFYFQLSANVIHDCVVFGLIHRIDLHSYI